MPVQLPKPMKMLQAIIEKFVTVIDHDFFFKMPAEIILSGWKYHNEKLKNKGFFWTFIPLLGINCLL